MNARGRRLGFGICSLVCLLAMATLNIWQHPARQRAAYLVKFAPGGGRIAALGEDLSRKEGWAGVWDAATGRLVHSFVLPERTVALAFSPDGTALATGGWDGKVTIWDLATARARKSFAWFRSPVRGLLFLPGGERLAAGASEGSVVVADIASGEIQTRYERGLRFPINQLVASHDGRFLAAAGGLGAGSVSVWDLRTGQAVKLNALAGGWEPISFAPTGAVLAMGAPSGAGGPGLRFVDVETDRTLATFPAPSARCVTFSTDGQFLAWGGDDEMVSVRAVASGRALGTFSGHKRPAELLPSPVRNLLADVGAADRRVQNTVWSVAFSPDGATLASASHDGSVLLWSVPTAKAPPQVTRALVAASDSPAWLPLAECALALTGLVCAWLAVISRPKQHDDRRAPKSVVACVKSAPL